MNNYKIGDLVYFEYIKTKGFGRVTCWIAENGKPLAIKYEAKDLISSNGEQSGSIRLSVCSTVYKIDKQIGELLYL